MNHIFWSDQTISMLTDQIEAERHSHIMLQLFLSLTGDVNVEIAGEEVCGTCVIVNKNVSHAFMTGQTIHYSMLIDPTSGIAESLYDRYQEQDYYIFQGSQYPELLQLQNQLRTWVQSCQQLCQQNQMQKKMELVHEEYDQQDVDVFYTSFLSQLYQALGLQEKEHIYDERILKLIKSEFHSIHEAADELALSESRLSHLFREEVGISLKSYLQLHQMQQVFTALLQGSNITEAALQSGFDSPSHFAATAKRMMGMSARESLKHSDFLKV